MADPPLGRRRLPASFAPTAAPVPSSITAAFPDKSIILIRTSSYSLAMIKNNGGRNGAEPLLFLIKAEQRLRRGGGAPFHQRRGLSLTPRKSPGCSRAPSSSTRS